MHSSSTIRDSPEGHPRKTKLIKTRNGDRDDSARPPSRLTNVATEALSSHALLRAMKSSRRPSVISLSLLHHHIHICRTGRVYSTTQRYDHQSAKGVRLHPIKVFSRSTSSRFPGDDRRFSPRCSCVALLATIPPTSP